MAFNNGADTIEIRVEVPISAAQKNLQTVGKETDAVGEKAEKAGTKFSGLEKKLIGVAAGFAAAVVSVKTFSAAIDAIEAGARIEDITQSFTRLSAQAGVSADSLRTNLSQALGGTISQLDVMQRANELLIAGLDPSTFDEMAQAARALSDATGVELTQSLNQVSDAFIRGNDRALKAIGIRIDQEKAETEFAKSLGITRDQLNEEGKVQAARQALLNAVIEQTQRLGVVTNDSADNIAVIGAKLEDFTNEVQRAISTNPELNKVLEDLAKTVSEIDFQPLINGVTDLTTAFAKFLNVIPVQTILTGIGTASDLAAKAISISLNPATALAGIALDQIKQNATAAIGPITDLGTVGLSAGTKLRKSATDFTKATDNAKELADQAAKTAEELDKLAEAHDKAYELPPFKSQLGSFFDLQPGSAEDGALEGFEGAVSSAVINGFQNGFDRTDFATLGSQAGSAIGASMAGPIGAAIGGAVGNFIADGFSGLGKGGAGNQKAADTLAKLLIPVTGGLSYALNNVISDGLFGQSAATTARKQADKFFADLFAVNDIAVVVNGQLQQLKDLVFSGNQDGGSGIFATLGTEAQSTFTNIGDSLAAALGLGKDAAINLGVVLANNGVQLQDLQAIIQATGQSFEGLADQMFDSFYLGKQSVLELQDQLEELYGIVSGSSVFADLGAAFNGIAAAGFNGGRQLFNALQSVGIEAQQLGLNLNQIPNILVSQFGVAAGSVAQLMQAMAASGITSVEQLVNASNALLASVGANLQQIQNGQGPSNTPVTTPSAGRSNFAPVAAPRVGGGGGGGTARSGGSTGTARVDPAKAKREQEKKQQLDAIERLITGSVRYDDILKQLNAHTITTAQAQSQLDALYKSVSQNVKELSTLEEKADRQLKNKGKVSVDVANAINQHKEAQEALRKEIKKSTEANTGDRFAQFLDQYKGNLDYMTLAADRAGVSIQQLADKTLSAFMGGTQSFKDAKAALDDLYGGNDAKKQFEKFVNDGINGGALSEQAFKNIAEAVKNAGGTSLDSLSDTLLGSGVDREQIQKFFIALQNNGIDSLDAISNVSDRTFVNIGAQLQDIGFKFGEATDETKRVNDLINNIQPKTIEIKLNVTTALDSSAKSLVKAGYLPQFADNSSNSTVSTPKAAPNQDKSSKGQKSINAPAGYALTSRKGIYRNLRTRELESF